MSASFYWYFVYGIVGEVSIFTENFIRDRNVIVQQKDKTSQNKNFGFIVSVYNIRFFL